MRKFSAVKKHVNLRYSYKNILKQPCNSHQNFSTRHFLKICRECENYLNNNVIFNEVKLLNNNDNLLTN